MKKQTANQSPAIPSRLGSPARQRGNALLAIIAVVAVLAALGVAYQASVQSQVRTYDALALSIARQNAADAAVNLGVWRVVRDWRADPAGLERASWRCRQNGAFVGLVIEDESARLNLNLADAGSIAREIIAAGVSPAQAPRIAGRIADYVDRDSSAFDGGPEIDAFAAAGAPAPKNAPMEVIDELEFIPGVDAAMADTLAAALSLHSPRSDRLARTAGAAARGEAPRGVYRVTAIVRGDEQSEPSARRTAIIELDPAAPSTPAIRVWSPRAMTAHDDAPRRPSGECRVVILGG